MEEIKAQLLHKCQEDEGRFVLTPPPTEAPNDTDGTVFENHRKSLIQHCERSELRLHFEWTKVH